MCGGFALFNDSLDFEERFNVSIPFLKPKYNIRPGMDSLVIHNGSADKMRFGLVPVWAKDESIGYKLINARTETLFDKPVWKKLAKSKRCIIPASGFYEWKKEGSVKQPYFIKPTDQELFSFAGLFDTWRNPKTNEEISSFSIITTEPNSEMKKIHNRMPVILDKSSERNWMSDEEDEGFLRSVLQPYHNKGLSFRKVSTLVNSPRNQGKELLDLQF